MVTLTDMPFFWLRKAPWSLVSPRAELNNIMFKLSSSSTSVNKLARVLD